MRRKYLFLPPFLGGLVLLLVFFSSLPARGQPLDEPRITTHTSVQAPAFERPYIGSISPKPDPREVMSILIWPVNLADFMDSYTTWEQWILFSDSSPYVIRNNILIVLQAIIQENPDIWFETLEPESDLILVTGKVGEIWRLLQQLENYPLIDQIREDNPHLRTRAGAAWDETLQITLSTPEPYAGDLIVNVRHNWVWNLVWGYTLPNTELRVVLTDTTGKVHAVTSTTDERGLYLAYLPHEIKPGDRIEVEDQRQRTELRIPTIDFNISDREVEVNLSSKGTLQDNYLFTEVVLGKSLQPTSASLEGRLSASFSEKHIPAGTPGFISTLDSAGNMILAPLTTPIVSIRYGSSYEFFNPHIRGVSSTVFGTSQRGTSIILTLIRSGSTLVTRTYDIGENGHFRTSMDHIILDGDIIALEDFSGMHYFPVTELTYEVDLDTKIITGTAPANITSTVTGDPHTLMITIDDVEIQLTTDEAGRYTADLSALPYLPGRLGTISYFSPNGGRVAKNIFVMDPLARGVIGDYSADIVLGQPDFTEISPNEVGQNYLFNPHGVHIDRSVQPNRLYVYDAGNNRVLGLSHLGTCAAGPNVGQACTANSDCPASFCGQ